MQALQNCEKNEEKRLILFCFLATFFFIASLFIGVFVYPCFAIYVAAVLILDNSRMFRFLLFTFSFAVAFKVSGESMSFFTLVELVALMKLVLVKRKFQIPFLASILLLTAEMLISSWICIDVIKILLELFLFYFFAVDYNCEDAHKYSSYFIAGLIVSSAVGAFKERIPRLLQMYDDLNYEWINGEYTIRFSGIFNDPNYFAIPVTLCAVVLLSVLMCGSSTGKGRWLLVFGVISMLGFATISKSFFLVYFAIVLLYAFFAKSEKKPLKLIAVIAVLLVLLAFNPFGLLDGILARFESTDLTTGRTRIWGYYIAAIEESWKTLLLGYGANAPYVRRAAHNMYIETVYYLGLIGMILFFAVLLIIVRTNACRFKRNILNYLGFGTMAAQFFMLCGLKAYELPFYLMVAYMVYNNDYANGSVLIGGTRKNAHMQENMEGS